MCSGTQALLGRASILDFSQASHYFQPIVRQPALNPAEAGQAPPEDLLSSGWFFPLLLAVSLIPYVWIPLSWDWFPELGGRPMATVALLFVASQAHVGASFFFYTDSEMRNFMLRERPWRFIGGVLGIIVAYPLVSILVDKIPAGELQLTLAFLLISFYSAWQVHHYSRQSRGILSFLSKAESAPLSPTESRALSLTALAGILGVLGFSYPAAEPMKVIVGILPEISMALMAAGWLVWIASLIRDRPQHSWRRQLAMALTLAFFFPLYFFDDIFPAFFSFATAHGLQYFVFMWMVSRPRGEAATKAAPRIESGGQPALRRWKPALTMVGCGLGIGGLILTLPLAFGLGIVMAHFVLDAGVWKLSEPFPRNYMAQRFPFLR